VKAKKVFQLADKMANDDENGILKANHHIIDKRGVQCLLQMMKEKEVIY
jgi:hypothetical protein